MLGEKWYRASAACRVGYSNSFVRDFGMLNCVGALERHRVCIPRKTMKTGFGDGGFS